MAYCNPTHVEARNSARTFSATSNPSLADVTQYCEEISSEIDGILLARGYSLPVPTTATAALAQLQKYNTDGAWFLVEDGAKSSPFRDQSKAMWESAQKMLADGKVELVGAPKDLLDGVPRIGSTPTPFFCRDMQF